jgi:Domain of unknown function (DUF4160)
MPMVLLVNGHKFKFFSYENQEPAHVHIFKGSGKSKIWLRPSLAEEYSYNFTVREKGYRGFSKEKLSIATTKMG